MASPMGEKGWTVGGWRALGGLASIGAFVALGAMSAGCSHETAQNRQVATATTTTTTMRGAQQGAATQQQVNELQRQLANQKRAACLAEVARNRAEKNLQMEMAQAQQRQMEQQRQMGQQGQFGQQGQMAQRPCPAPQTKLLTIPSDLLFGFDEDTLLPNANQRLDKAVSALQIDPQSRIVIVGHADSVGDPDYNVDLSERRAKAVGQYLTDHGIAPDRLQIEGHGANQPIADNDTPEGRATNRRVELYVQRGTTQF